MKKTKKELIRENDYKKCKLWEMCEMKQKEEGLSEENINRNTDVLENAISYAIDYLEKIEITLPKFTMHGYKHSFNVLELMGRLLINMKVISRKDGQEKVNLTSYEIALLILSAFFHDIGMSIDGSLEDVEKEREYITFKKFNNMLGDEEKTSLKYIRAMHHKRVYIFIMKFLNDRNNELIWIQKNGNKIQIQTELISICKSHNMDETYLREISAEQERDNRFCAIILRLADILDLDNTRAPMEKMENIKFEDTPEDKYSQDEWRKHLQSEGFIFEDEHETITLHGNTKVPETSQKIEYMLEIIRKEIDLCREILPTVSVRFRDCRLPGKVKNGVSTEGFISGDYSYHIDTNKAIDLFMGEKLYMDNMVFIRELLQNAIDSTIYYSKLQNKEKFDPVHIYIWKNENEEVYFGIEDNGTGMTKDIIEKFFLNIGKSFYMSTQFQKSNVKFIPISRFGIGFLTSFLVTEEVSVLTRHYTEECILQQLTLNINMKQYILRMDDEKKDIYQIPYDMNNKLLDKRVKINNPGTTITFKIKPEIADESIEEIEKAIVDYSFGVPVSIKADILGKQIEYKGLENVYMNQQSVKLDKETIGKIFYGDAELLREQDDIIFESVPLDINYENEIGKISGNIQVMTVFDTKEKPNLYAFYVEPDYTENLLYIKLGNNYKERIDNIHLNAKYEQFGVTDKIKVYFNGINHLIFSSKDRTSMKKAYFLGYILLEGNFRPEVDVARSGKGYLNFEALAGLNYTYWKALSTYVGDDEIKKEVYFSIEQPNLFEKLGRTSYNICDIYNSIIMYDWDLFDIVKTNLGYLSIKKIKDMLTIGKVNNIELLENISINQRLDFHDYLIRFLLQKNFKIVIRVQKNGSKVYIKNREKEEIFDNSHFLPLFFIEYDGFEVLKYTNYPLNSNHWFSAWLKGKSKEKRFSRYLKQIVQHLEKDLNEKPKERIVIISEINKILNREKEERTLKTLDINIWEKENNDIREWLEIQ